MESKVSVVEIADQSLQINGGTPEVTDDAERRLIQARQFTFDLFRREGLIRDVDLPNVSFNNVSFDQCLIRLVDRVNHPWAIDEPYVADIDRFLRSVVTDEDRSRYSDLGYLCKTWVYAPWDISRLAQARRLVLEIEPRAELFMDKDIVDCSFSDCLCWFRGYFDCPNPDQEMKARINDFLTTKVTEGDWAYYWYDINSDPLELSDPPEDGCPVGVDGECDLSSDESPLFAPSVALKEQKDAL